MPDWGAKVKLAAQARDRCGLYAVDDRL